MATVHFGRLSGPVGFSRTVAIKRLHPNFATDPEFVAMFLDEARLAARIRHPNVVPTLDVVATGGEVFIVLEYVSGESLARLWRAHAEVPIPLPCALAIVAGLLHGLHAAHEVRDEQGHPLGIVHRDVSPQNILVGTDGVARIIDFGVAKAAGRLQETGDSGALKGKIAYMAPEQISGGEVSRRTDIYAAGVVLWELLTSRRLVDGENDAQRAAKILASQSSPSYEPPSKWNPRVTPALDAIVKTALAWSPADRFATAKEMAALLERNGGLVAATEVGDWVAQLAGPALGERAGRLHAIESSLGSEKSRPVLPPTSEGGLVHMPPSAAHGPPGSAEAEPTIAAAPPVFVEEGGRANEPRRRGRAVALLALLTVLVVVAGFGAGTLALRRGPRLAAAEVPTHTAVTASAEPPPSASPPPSAAATGSGTETSAAVPADPTAPATVGSAAPDGSSRRNVRSGPAPRAAPKPPDCDPPYVIDAENHKVYKRECLK